MYRINKIKPTSIKSNTSYKGETIEDKIRRITLNKEPISDGAPLIYTERKDGVRPEYDIRTDRFEIAIDAMDKVSKSYKAKREQKNKPNETENPKSGNKDNNETRADNSDSSTMEKP